MRRDKTEQAMRLECLKIAANVVCQLKNERISVVDTATAYYKFLTSGDGYEGLDDEAHEADGSAADRLATARPEVRHPYTLKDLRRGS